MTEYTTTMGLLYKMIETCRNIQESFPGTYFNHATNKITINGNLAKNPPQFFQPFIDAVIRRKRFRHLLKALRNGNDPLQVRQAMNNVVNGN